MEGVSPEGTTECEYGSVVPSGLGTLFLRPPKVETLGYFRWSLRDKTQTAFLSHRGIVEPYPRSDLCKP